MKSSLIAVLLLHSLSQAWLSCMTFSCSNLLPNACATLGPPSSILLANSPCNSGFECRLSDVMSWYTSNVTTRTNIFPCSKVAEVTIGPNWSCSNREALKNLKEGTYPKSCLSQNDCVLLDGTANDCVCAPRSTGTQGYCRPDASSSYFQEYWDACTVGQNVIADEYDGFYWYLRTNFAVYYDTANLPNCTANLWEFSMLEAVKTEMTNSAALLATGFLIFA